MSTDYAGSDTFPATVETCDDSTAPSASAIYTADQGALDRTMWAYNRIGKYFEVTSGSVYVDGTDLLCENGTTNPATEGASFVLMPQQAHPATILTLAVGDRLAVDFDFVMGTDYSGSQETSFDLQAGITSGGVTYDTTAIAHTLREYNGAPEIMHCRLHGEFTGFSHAGGATVWVRCSFVNSAPSNKVVWVQEPYTISWRVLRATGK